MFQGVSWAVHGVSGVFFSISGISGAFRRFREFRHVLGVVQGAVKGLWGIPWIFRGFLGGFRGVLFGFKSIPGDIFLISPETFLKFP